VDSDDVISSLHTVYCITRLCHVMDSVIIGTLMCHLVQHLLY